MELPDQARRALDVALRDGHDVRLEVAKVCGDDRYRLSVRFRRRPGGDEVRVGLLYAPDRAALEALRDRLRPSQPAGGGRSAAARSRGAR